MTLGGTFKGNHGNVYSGVGGTVHQSDELVLDGVISTSNAGKFADLTLNNGKVTMKNSQFTNPFGVQGAVLDA